MSLSVLVTGVTGYVGSQLVPRLQGDGHRVRGFARSGASSLGIEVVRGDVSTGAGLEEAMAGIDVAFYLIHSMEGGDGDFSAQELDGAKRFAAAGRGTGVRRVVFLGGLTPDDDAGGSEHLESRGAVEEVLLDAFPEGVAFRASMVIGHGSRSFDLLSELVEQLPVLALPAWRDRRTQPIDHRDVVDYLALAVASDAVGHAEVFEIGGDGTTTYGEMVTRIADLAVDGRPSVDLPFDATPIASRLTAAVTGEDVGLVRPLMESLQHDLVPDDARARAFFSLTPRPLDESLRDAVAQRAAG